MRPRAWAQTFQVLWCEKGRLRLESEPVVEKELQPCAYNRETGFPNVRWVSQHRSVIIIFLPYEIGDTRLVRK